MIEDMEVDANGDLIYIGFNPKVARKEHFDKKDKFVKLGSYYGFPGCCIRYFCVTIFPGLSLPDDHWASGTGYVPCPSCREMEKEELIGIINSRRNPKEKPFGE